MSFRVSALASATVLFGLGAFTPASAQPQAPIRPRTSTFSSVFTPGLQQQQLMQQQFIQNAGLGLAGPGGLIGPAFANPGLTGFGGLNYPNSQALPQFLPGALTGTNARLPPSGIVGSFNYYSHWYNPRGNGYYSHWYPNGIANGRGALSNNGGGYGGFGGYGNYGSGMSGGAIPNSGIGTLGGTALGVGATLNQLRR